MWRIITYYFCGQIMEDNLFYSLLLFRQFLCTFEKVDSTAWILWRSFVTGSLWRIMWPNHGGGGIDSHPHKQILCMFWKQDLTNILRVWMSVERDWKPCIYKRLGWEPVHKKYKANKSLRAQVGDCQRNYRIHEIGQSEPAPTSAPVGRSVHMMGCVSSFGSRPCVNPTFYHSQPFWAAVLWLFLLFCVFFSQPWPYYLST